LLLLLAIAIASLLDIRRQPKRVPLLLLPATSPATTTATPAVAASAPASPKGPKTTLFLLLLLLKLPRQRFASSNEGCCSCICGPCSN
jgi:hypothetical protein